MTFYSDEEKQWIRDHQYQRYAKDIAAEFSELFRPIKTSQIQDFRSRFKLDSGITGLFQKGLTPPKKRPIGSERTERDGYIKIKVAENTWIEKHRYIWEQMHHQSVPKGHVVIFADSNRNNFDPNNLILVNRSELVRMNKYGRVTNFKEITESNLALTKLELTINKAKRR
ncbi:HNH endonuclease signature motif containing protein [Latilactobacillus curvatus]|uniref:HNH endonuclease signature motif containing protein n=1 Tax=Latilactobacillus curvatus TaxID=28038 RepID=UPI00223BCBD9|nr:HNH endonuclease signature motif containing protein [Latilactobacillus curvatus]MCS8616357.1 HNH endonuclease [Latilactobacillus curvatus]